MLRGYYQVSFPVIWYMRTDLLRRIGPINPGTISVGDIVEVGISFVAFPIKENKMRMVSSLRSIRVLDRDCRNVCLLYPAKSHQSVMLIGN